MKPKFFRATRLSFPLVTALAAMFASQTSHAQTTRTWDTSTGNAWLTAANWSNDTVPGAVGSSANTDIAQFNTVAISGNSLGINMNTSTYVYSVGAIHWNMSTGATAVIGNSTTTTGAAGTLRLNGASVNVGTTGGTISNLLVGIGDSATQNLTIQNTAVSGNRTMGVRLGSTAGTMYVASGRALAISSIISESTASSGFTKSGAGTLTLSGANTFTGVTTVSDGLLVAGNATALGTTAGNTIVSGTGGLRVQTTGIALAEPLSLSGTGGGNGAISVAGSATGVGFSGAITLGADALIYNNGSTGSNYSGGINTAGFALTMQQDGGATATVSTTGISGSGSLTKTSSGTLSLTASNSYTGSTTISGGVVNLGNTNPFGTIPGTNGTSGISMSAGTVLQAASGSGTTTSVAAPITLSGTGDATLRIGSGAASTTTIFNLNGAIGGSITNLVFSTGTASFGNGTSRFVLNAASDYTGITLITTGNSGNNPVFVSNGIANALPTSTVLSFAQVAGGGTGRNFLYDLNGYNQTLAGLDNGGIVPQVRRMLVSNTSATAATLTINNATNFTFGGSTISTTVGTAGSLTSAQISGNLSLVKNGTGTFTLGGTYGGGATPQGHTFTGSTTVLGGVLVLGEFNSLQNSPFDTTVSITGDADNGLRISTANLTLGGLTGNKNFADTFETTSGGYTGLTALTLNPGTGATHSYAADIGNGSGALTLTKTGAGTQVLAGAMSHTGSTAVNAGILTLDYSTQNNSKLSDAAALVLGGGTLNLSGGTHAESVLSTTLTAGTTSFVTSTGAAPLQMNAITVGDGAKVDFGANGIATTDNLNNAYGVLGGWATVNGVLAVNSTNSADGLITAATSSDVTRLDGGLQIIPDSAGANIRIVEGTGTAANLTLAAATTTVNTLFQTAVGGTSAATIDSGTQTLLTNAVIVDTGAGALTIGNGNLASATAGGNLELSPTAAANTITIDSVIANNTSASSLTKSGAGTVTLSNANTYDGPTIVNAGILSITHSDALGSTTGATTVNGGNPGSTSGNTLRLNNATSDLTIGENINLFGSPAGRALLINDSIQSHTLNGAINVSSDTNLSHISSNGTGSITVNGDITGTMTNGAILFLRGTSTNSFNRVLGSLNLTGANLAKTDAGTWLVGAPGESYSWANTQIFVGTLSMGASGVLPASGELIMGNSTGSSTSALDLNGFNQTTTGITFNGAGVATGTKTITNNDAINSAIFTINNTSDYVSGSAAGANNIVLTGNLGLTKQGAGKLTLRGTNTHTGDTIVSAGTLVVNGSFSSSPVNLNAGTLTGSGTVSGAVTVANTAGAILSNNDGAAGAAFNVGALTFNGAATVNTFSSSIAAPIVASSLASNAAGTVTINPSAPSWISGATYELISYGGGSIGGAGLAQFALGTVSGLGPRQSTSTLADTGSAITITIAVDPPKWTGLDNSSWKTGSTGSNENWKLLTAATATAYIDGDDVLFDDSATGTTTVDISTANVSPASTTFSNSSLNYTLTGTSGIATGSLVKNGTGTSILLNPNTYPGATTINAGILQLGNGTDGNDGTIANTSGVTNNGTLVFHRFGTSNTIGYVISGSGSVVKKGVGTQTFPAANSYAGGLTVQEGIAVLGQSAAAGTGTITFSNGGLAPATVQLNIGANTLLNAITVAASSTATNTISNVGTGQAKLDGAVVIDTGATLTFDNSSSNNAAIDVGTGSITGNGSVAATGTSTGNFIFRGINTYSGGTSLSGAGLFVPATSSTGSGAGTTDGVFGTGTLSLGTISMRSTTLADTTIGNTLSLNGDFTAVDGGTSEKSLTFSGPASLTASRVITSNVGASVTGKALIFSGAISDGGSGFGITKAGTGNMILTAANTYSGPTVISGGKLQLGNGTTGNDGTINNTSGVTNDGLLEFNRFGTVTAGYPIHGTGNISKTGAGSQTLSGGGTLTGNLLISDGTVRVGATNGIPSTAGLELVAGAPATATLDLNGQAQTLSKFIFSGTNSSSSLTITGGAGSKLSVLTSTNTELGPVGTMNGDRLVSVDMSGLGEFVWDGPLNVFRIGIRSGTASNSSAGVDPDGTVLLAGNNTITAAQLAMATQGASSNGGTAILRLGQTNVLNASLINVGTSGRSNATLDFNTGLTNPTVKIRGTDGTSRVTNWDLGRVANISATTTWTTAVDFSAGELDATVSTMRIGRADTTSQTSRIGTTNATFSMGKGILDVNTLIIGQFDGQSGSTVNNTLAGNGTFTLNSAEGTVTAENIILADNVGLATGGTTRSATGTFNLTDGNLEAKTIGKGADTGTANVITRVINFAGGKIRNYAASDLAISDVPITLTGSGTRIIEATTGQSITLASTSPIGDGGNALGFTKQGDGTLTLGGVNTYTGATTITAGSLLITGSTAAGSTVTVASAGLLGGTGTVGGNTTVSGILSPGTTGLSALAFGGTLSLDATSTASFEVDADTVANRDRVTGVSALTYGGKLKITATGTLNAGDSWDLFDFTSHSGTFANNSSFGTDGSSDPDLPDLSSGLVWQFDYASGTLSVATGGSAFSSWASSKGLDGTAGKENGKADDPDKDGKNNLQEFAFNGNPLDAADNGMIVGFVQDTDTPADTKELTLIVAVRNGATFSSSGTPAVQAATVDGITYTIEGSLDLIFPGSAVSLASGPSNTAPAGSGLTVDLSSSDWKYYTFTLDASEGLPNKGFLRAKVSE